MEIGKQHWSCRHGRSWINELDEKGEVGNVAIAGVCCSCCCRRLCCCMNWYEETNEGCAGLKEMQSVLSSQRVGHHDSPSELLPYCLPNSGEQDGESPLTLWDSPASVVSRVPSLSRERRRVCEAKHLDCPWFLAAGELASVRDQHLVFPLVHWRVDGVEYRRYDVDDSPTQDLSSLFRVLPKSLSNQPH